jgi:hypothetical protein
MDRIVTFKQEDTSGHELQPGLDTKIDRLTDRQSQCDFDFDFSQITISSVGEAGKNRVSCKGVQLKVRL